MLGIKKIKKLQRNLQSFAEKFAEFCRGICREICREHINVYMCHGGEDSGAVGNGIIEKDLNLKIANYMYDRFKSLGIPVKIIRSTDETISPNERVNRV